MDAARFNNLVLPMSKKLLHFAFQMLHDTGEAEDAVQEVILKLWKIRDSLENYNSLEAFSMKITRNWCLDRLKAIIGDLTNWQRRKIRKNKWKRKTDSDSLMPFWKNYLSNKG
jgi:RNA polymerase sigma factor (sigma-70 family)